MSARIALAIALTASIASAQLDQARQYLDNADFARAVRAFDRAEQSDAMDRDALVSLYEGRAIAQWALGREEQARGDLRALGSIDPEHAFPPEAPPALRDAFAESSHEPIRLAIAIVRSEGHAALNAEVVADPAGIVRSLQIHARVAERAWETQPNGSITVEAAESDRVEGYVEAIGPGGAIVARAEPTTATTEPTASPVEGSPRPETRRPTTSNDDWVWATLGIGSGVLVVAIVVIVLVAISVPNDATQLGPPMLRF